jgi:hypothetical protein
MTKKNTFQELEHPIIQDIILFLLCSERESALGVSFTSLLKGGYLPKLVVLLFF